MKRLLRVLIPVFALALLTACAAAEGGATAAEGGATAETAFVFHDGIGWNTSADDMLKAEGAYGAGKYTAETSGDCTIYMIEGSPAFDAYARISYTYYGETLAMIGIYFPGETGADYDARLRGLADQYGEPAEYGIDTLNQMFRFVVDNKAITDYAPAYDGWLLSDGTRVYIILINGHLYEYYMNEAVVLQMNESL